jgi:mRNA interferase MazF
MQGFEHGDGLPAASVVRPCKIATIEARHAQRIGKLAKPALKAVMRQIHTIISEAG